MARLRCPCGNVLSNSSDADRVENYVLSEKDLESLDTSEDPVHDIIDNARSLWRCDHCGNLWLEKDDGVGDWFGILPT